MKYKDFLKTAEKLGEGARVETKIDGTVITDAKLHKEDRTWYICQNEVDGLNCENKLGYKYSWEGYNQNNTKYISYLRPTKPIKKTLYNLEKGDVVENVNGQRKIMEKLGECYLLSECNAFDRFGGWYFPKDLEDCGYHLVNQPATPETIEVLGKTYLKSDVEEKLAELMEVEEI